MLEVRFAAAEALSKEYAKKNNVPTAASAMAQINSIMENNNEAEKEAALMELAQALINISVHGDGSSSFYFTATSCAASQKKASIKTLALARHSSLKTNT